MRMMVAAPPPFSILYFEIHTTSSSYNFGAMMSMTRSQRLEPDINKNQKSHLEGSEDSILKDFSEYILAKDPDILVSSNQHSRSTTILDYLFIRMSELGLDLQLGRDKKTNKTNKIEGRVYLSNKSFHTI